MILQKSNCTQLLRYFDNLYLYYFTFVRQTNINKNHTLPQDNGVVRANAPLKFVGR